MPIAKMIDSPPMVIAAIIESQVEDNMSPSGPSKLAIKSTR